ncbi:DUF393 domain-containing protein [bacterium]|nr:DUF393 domain-containing protein [bacterium]
MQFNKNIIYFDGECNLCNRSVDFIIRNDNDDLFRFSSLQSTNGQSMLNKFRLPQAADTMYLFKNEKLFTKSQAWLEILYDLGGFWKVLYFLTIIPLQIRDFIYDLIAKNRVYLFGASKTCRTSSKSNLSKFLD